MKLIVVTIETRCYWPLQTCYDMVTTNPATTNAPQPGHYNLAITRPLRICYNNGHYKLLQPDHYKLATTPSLQPHYELATTLSLQPGHYHHLATTILPNLATTTWPQPSHYATTWPLQTCYSMVTTAQPLLWLQIPCSKRTILSTPCLLSVWVLLHCCLPIMSIKCQSYVFIAHNICGLIELRKQSKLACRHPSLQWVCYSHQCTTV